MSANFNIRAEDFRHAWPTAYCIAMHQVAELQMRADKALLKSEISLARSTKVAAEIAEKLDSTCAQIVREIQKSGDQQIRKLELATQALMLQIASLKEQDRVTLENVERAKKALVAGRRELDVERQTYIGGTLINRLRIAVIGPRKRPATSNGILK
jgi:hypothetical protein